MKTRQEEAKERKEAADKRTGSADRVRGVGSTMMIIGGGAVAVVFTVNIAEPQVPIWARGNLFTIAGIVLIIGAVSYVGGQVLRHGLAQLADDRAEREAQHDEQMSIFRDIKRNQTFLLARPSAEGAPGTFHHPEKPVLPSADTMDLVDRVRRHRVAARKQADQPDESDVDVEAQADERWQDDVAEAYRLGQQNPRPGEDPPAAAN